MRFAFNPWYGVAGLGQGVLQGTMAGIEMSREKRLAKQEQVREALSLLQTGIKAGDPDTLQAMEPYLKSILGPQFQMPQVKTEAQRLEQQAQQMGPWLEKMGVPKEMVPWLIMGQKPPTAGAERGGKWFTGPGGQTRFFTPNNPPPQGWMPTHSEWKPQTPITAVPYDPTRPPSGKYDPGTHFFPTKTEKEPPGITEGISKRITELETSIRQEKNPQVRESYIAEYERMGGKVDIKEGKKGRVWNDPDEIKFQRPDVRAKGTPWSGGQKQQMPIKGTTRDDYDDLGNGVIQYRKTGKKYRWEE